MGIQELQLVHTLSSFLYKSRNHNQPAASRFLDVPLNHAHAPQGKMNNAGHSRSLNMSANFTAKKGHKPSL